MHQILFRLAALFLALALAACGSDDDGEPVADTSGPRMETIRGTLNYVEDITLAPESTVTVELLDVTKADPPAAVIADTVVDKPGRPPLPFALEYDASMIEPGRQYSVRARVMEQKRLMFVSDRDYRVLDEDSQGPVEITLNHVPGGHIERMAENVRKRNPTLIGHYRYSDKQGEFVDCSDGVSHPLAREEGIYALESEYRDVVPEYGDEVFVTLVGKYATRPARSGRGKEEYLIVLQVEEMSASGTCP